MLNGKVVLVTGGTGSFGQKFVEMVLHRYQPARLIVFSRDELKQSQMQERFSQEEHDCMRYFIGDVRDRDRLYRAFDGVDYVIHAAAMKQVPACEYNPLEAVKTNVLGAANVVDAAIDRGVQRVVALSTDKAASPVNLYGATKLSSDKLFTAGNAYAASHDTRFSVVRYGNVVGSRGSVIPLYERLRQTGVLPVTDPRMTRFWITLEQGVTFVLASLERMHGGEIFVPKIPSANIMDVAKAVGPECKTRIVGIRPGEKLHEVMITEDDARNTLEYGDHFAIQPSLKSWDSGEVINGGRRCDDSFRYSSDTNTEWLTVQDLQRLIGMPEAASIAV
jgi:UDP-N-acetylglucosamine 4,6-dehydratase/5-epimerase